MEKRRMRKNLLLGACLAGVLAVGGIFAYFTDTDSAANVFTVGKVEVDLTEPEYDAHPEDHKDLTPDKVLDKDPKVTNTGINDVFVFMEVTIPKATVSTAAENGSQNPAANQELFTYEVSEGWVQVVKDDKADGCRYVYAYSTGQNCSVLKSEKTTPPLFKDGKIRFINVIEGQGLEEESLELPVEVYGIQATDLNGGKTDPAGVWAILETQQAGQ